MSPVYKQSGPMDITMKRRRGLTLTLYKGVLETRLKDVISVSAQTVSGSELQMVGRPITVNSQLCIVCCLL